jgi:DeoR/GlpR family transcriptional regulator of sugar metabolism
MENGTGVPGVEVRRRQELALIRSEGPTKVETLAERLRVSVETVRRDLSVLSDRGLVARFHGGASATESGRFETNLMRRSGHFTAEKRRIAAEAARRLAEAETIFLDEGYTPQLIAEQIPTDVPRSIVTASLPIAATLSSVPNFSVYLAGGRVRDSTLACADNWAARMVGSFAFDVAVIGANGISLERGLTTPDPAVAMVKTAAMESARARLFIGIHTKFGVAAFARFGKVEDLDAIITDTHLASSVVHHYQARGPVVVCV